MTISPGRRFASSRPLPAAGLLLLLLGSPAFAADFQLDNLKLDFGKFVVSIPKLDVKGTPLDRDSFRALLLSGTSAPPAGGVAGAIAGTSQAVQPGESAIARLGKLTASEISAPTLVMEQNFGPQKQVTTYRNIKFSDIREGRIGRGESSDGSIKVEGAATGPMNGEIKRISFEVLDLMQIARIFGEQAKPGETAPLQPIIGKIDQDGYVLDLGEQGKITAGKASMRGFKARVASEPMGELLTRIAVLSDEAEKASRDLNSKEDPALSEARERKLLLAMAEIFEAVDYGSGEVRDLVMALKTPPKPGAKAEPVDMRIQRIAFGEDAPDKSGVAIEGLQFEGSGAKGVIGLIGYSGFSLEGVIREVKAVANSAVDIKTLDFRRFIPKLGTVKMSGVQMSVPQDGKRGRPAGPPIQIGLGSFELKAGEQLNGIPTDMTLSLDKITFPIVESADNPAAKDLLAMGYRNIDLSAKLALAWQETSKEFAIRTLSLGGAGMARLDATGTLGNIGKEVFTGDLALAQVALLGATAKNVELKLQNLGLAEKLVENEAKKSKRKVEDVRREYGMMASLGLAAILGPSDGAKALANAVARFVAKPGTLTVKATAKTPAGLGLADVIALGEPTEIFEKIDVDATAE
ncbi:MAG: hypothetical protein GY873_18040 [Bosea sp.]|uniref:hypothetical protein n=1 Tax=Bosea sp. (in: a-proteobacteria) TaxID=1871050 RepID=UPI0023A166F9|nr:hypothetical protein [Bosea sp. (in: a-proteobacteria)]MCP4736090.1 hypothetical protein [Bosea sp. (in: a-proteobacteria)]